ncbi:MAG: serine/threonine protein kinase [Labilithrix sp.]|nr:serine/threonine protein kinase [Labilithrix sp.]MCW5810831.1 serine/threonine protein kinase [Labilithrix sp.]
MTSGAAVDGERLEALFDALVDLDTTELGRRLDAECAGEPALRAALERLLARDRSAAKDFLAPDAARAARALSTLVEAAHGAELRESAQVGRYRVLRKLAEGGMGDVYVAYDESLDRRVALKVLRATHDRTPSLRREAQALARLAHPNVVAIHEVGEHEGRPYVAMELVEGRTLAEWLEQEPRSATEILRVFVQCGRALVAAHAASIIHRDFKPSNVIVGTDGRARVLDFGISLSVGGFAPDTPTPDTALARSARGASRPLSRPLLGPGTPQFMSPEQFAGVGGEGVTAASDQFSFSVALYRALYRAAPFAGDDVGSLRRNVLAGALRRPPAAPVPEWIQPILFRGLARHAAARFDSLAEMLAAIERKLPLDPELDPSTSLRGRRWLVAFMLGAAAVVLATVVLGGAFGAMTSRHLVTVSAVVFGGALASVVALRRQLFANRFGGRVVAVVLVTTGTLLGHRVLALRFGQPVPQVIAVDLLVLALELALAAYLVQRAFAWCAAVFFAGALVATFAPAYALPAMVTATFGALAGISLAWRRD